MDLKDLRIIAQGDQAQIYEYGTDKVLRVLRNPEDEPLLQHEIEVMRALQNSGVSVPEVYGSLTVDGRPAVIVQRIYGVSMLDDDALCHGDFHPGNILKAGGRYYIIDWFGVYQGDILSDAAHTVMLLKNAPRVPGVGIVV